MASQRDFAGFLQVPRSGEQNAFLLFKMGFQVGAQGFGSLGPWREWLPSEQQEHKAGPAVFGKVRLEGRRALNYNAAWLVGTNTNTPSNTLRLQVEYEY